MVEATKQIFQLKFEYFDTNDPKYRIVKFADLPANSLFRYNNKFKIKSGNHFARDIVEEEYESVPDEDFVLCSNPIQIIENYIE